MIKRIVKKKKGFTLTELIVVITILGILTAIAVPLVSSYIGDSEKSTDNTNAKVIEGVLKRADAKRKDAAGNKFILSTSTGTTCGTAVKAELGKIPAIQQAGFKFFVKTATGEVVAASAAPATTGWQQIQ